MTRSSIRKPTSVDDAGSVILSRVQQSDGRLNTRPAVVLAILPPYQDLLISGISSKVRHEVVGFDDLLPATDPDFAPSGLKVDSLIRLGLLATIPASAVIGELGVIPSIRLVRLQQRLARHIAPPPPEGELRSETELREGMA